MRVWITLGVLFMGTLSADFDSLCEAAIKAQENAYCPYSNYRVGCALQGASGKIYTGCNVENASYPVGVCSERTAVVKAISEGEREFTDLVIVTKDGGMSCGMCRQMLYEFAPGIRIRTIDEAGNIVYDAVLQDIFPEAFGPHNLH